MPITFSLATSPTGKTYVRSVASGVIDVADAKHSLNELAPSGKYNGLPMLSVMEEGVSYTAEARREFKDLGTNPAVAIVVSSVALRVTLNFVLKASSLRNGKPGNNRFFNSETEAMSWLEEQMTK
jgi:hypothetical protein